MAKAKGKGKGKGKNGTIPGSAQGKIGSFSEYLERYFPEEHKNYRPTEEAQAEANRTGLTEEALRQIRSELSVPEAGNDQDHG